MSIANNHTYLSSVLNDMAKKWPDNRAINIVCHGHSVPAGYFATPLVDTFNSYPHLLHKEIKERYPFAVINVINTSIGGENSSSGSKRFEADVLCHKPDVITIDYGLNDRGIGLEDAKHSWIKMIENAIKQNIKILLLTPSWETSYFLQNENWHNLINHTLQIRAIADEYDIGLSDSFKAFDSYVTSGGDLANLLSRSNHPNRKGHDLITNELGKWFVTR